MNIPPDLSVPLHSAIVQWGARGRKSKKEKEKSDIKSASLTKTQVCDGQLFFFFFKIPVTGLIKRSVGL